MPYYSSVQEFKELQFLVFKNFAQGIANCDLVLLLENITKLIILPFFAFFACPYSNGSEGNFLPQNN